MSDSVRPRRRQPTRLPHPWDSPGKNTGVGCHLLLQCVKVKSLSHVQLLVTPWTAAYQAPPSWDSPGKNTGVGCHFFSTEPPGNVYAMLCLVTPSCPTLCNPRDCSLPGSSLQGGFFRQEYRSGLPSPPPGDLPNPGIEPRSPALRILY